MQARKVVMRAWTVMICGGVLLCGAGVARADGPPAVSTPPPAPAPIPFPITNAPVFRPNSVGTQGSPFAKPAELLVWDAVEKEQSVKPGAATAEFFFACTNVSDSEVVINALQTSCGCTVAKGQTMPWTIAPHTSGKFDVSVNLAGKSGLVLKTVTVVSTNAQKVLTVKINIPDNPETMRARNLQMATVDPQAIFKGDCARCHVTPAAGKVGPELYKTMCGVCHDAEHRATMVPDLKNLNHPTDYAFWKEIISNGKPNTLMPPFSVAKNGPLNEAQIESLAKLLSTEIPSKANFTPPNAAPVPTPILPTQKLPSLPPPPVIK